MKSLVLVVAAIALTQTGPSAEARPKYLERFYETYSTQGNIAELEKFQCGVCHVNLEVVEPEQTTAMTLEGPKRLHIN